MVGPQIIKAKPAVPLQGYSEQVWPAYTRYLALLCRIIPPLTDEQEHPDVENGIWRSRMP